MEWTGGSRMMAAITTNYDYVYAMAQRLHSSLSVRPSPSSRQSRIDRPAGQKRDPLRNSQFYQKALILASTGLALAGGMPLEAADQDARIENTALSSYNFKTYLRNDPIRVVSRNSAVTLTGAVSQYYHRFLAEETLAGMPGVKSVHNGLVLMEEDASDPAEATTA